MTLRAFVFSREVIIGQKPEQEAQVQNRAVITEIQTADLLYTPYAVHAGGTGNVQRLLALGSVLIMEQIML